MKLKLIVLTLLALLAIQAFGQKKLVFTDTVNHKTIKAKEGDYLKLFYHGYLGQLEESYGIINLVNDSMVVLGGRRGMMHLPRYIRIKDIVGFRKFWKGRELVRSIVNISITVGTFVLFNDLYKNNPDMGLGKRFLISAGAGFGGLLLVRLIFPERIKNYMHDGWTVRVE